MDLMSWALNITVLHSYSCNRPTICYTSLYALMVFEVDNYVKPLAVSAGLHPAVHNGHRRGIPACPPRPGAGLTEPYARTLDGTSAEAACDWEVSDLQEQSHSMYTELHIGRCNV
jgi:hypothetical protein